MDGEIRAAARGPERAATGGSSGDAVVGDARLWRASWRQRRALEAILAACEAAPGHPSQDGRAPRLDLVERRCEAALADPGCAAVHAPLRAGLARLQAIRDAVVRLHLPKVTLLAAGAEASADLVQDGAVGLLRAIDSFDPRRPGAFSAYAEGWIRQAISRAEADRAHLIRLPAHVHGARRRAKRIARSLQRRGRKATLARVARRLGLTAERLRTRLFAAPQVVSLNPAGLTPEPAGGRADHVGPDDNVLQQDLRIALARALGRLPARDERVLRQRFGLGVANELTLEEVARGLEISSERVRQIEAGALERLRRSPEGRRLRPFLRP